MTIHRKFYDHDENARTFRQTMPLDKLTAVMTRAEVEAARAEGRLIPIGQHGFALAKAPTPAAPAPADTVCPDGPPCPDVECRAERERQGLPVREPVANDPAHFAAMAATLKAGGVQVVTAPQLFPTPRELAERVAELADLQPGARVLEPSAGTGALLRAALRAQPEGLELVAVELNNDLGLRLSAEGLASVVEAGRDFLTCNGDLGKFDRIIMNPPFKDGADIAHILHARTFLKPGGRLVAICANGPRQVAKLQPIAEESGGTFEPLPPGSFVASGTNVQAALLVIEG